MANKKGAWVEPGIWRRPDGRGYLAEVNYPDPRTGRRVREQKSTNRLDLAQDWRKARKVDALRGVITRRQDKPKPVLFERLADEYLEVWARVKKRPSTFARDQWSVRRLVRTFGGRYLGDIGRRDIDRYLAMRKDDGVSTATMNRELCCLKNMLRRAVDWEYLRENPAAGIKQQREALKEFAFLTHDEIGRVLETCAPHLQTLLTVAIYTGMRRGELFKLEWRDVDPAKGECGLIAVRDPKNQEIRYIPMHPVVRDALTKHPKRVAQGRVGSLVFSRPDGSPMGDVRDGLEGALKRAGVTRRIRFHDLRHTFASHLVMRGVDLRTVAQLLGHRDIKMTMRYAHLAPEHLEAAVNALLSPAERSMEGVLAKSPR